MLNFFKRKVWALVLILCIITIPQALSTQAELKTRVLITGMAIDKTEKGYEVTAQVVIPSKSTNGGGDAKLSFISAEELAIPSAIEKISQLIGKSVGIAHLSFVIVGDSMFGEDLATSLDYFLRNRYINSSMILLLCDGSAKEEIVKTKYFELGSAISIQKIYMHKQEFSGGVSKSFLEFANSAYTKSAADFLSFIKIYKDEDANALTNNQNSNSISGRIEFSNKLGYFKNGKLVGILEDEQQLFGVSIMNEKSTEMYLTVDKINDELYKNASITMRINNKKVSVKTDFTNGEPTAKIKFDLSIAEYSAVVNENNALSDYKSDVQLLTVALKNAITEKITKCVMSAFDVLKLANVDSFGLMNELYKYHSDEYKKYEKENGNDAIFKNINIIVEVNVKKSN